MKSPFRWDMSPEWALLGAILIVIAMGIGVTILDIRQVEKCNALGGVYFESQCVEAKIIPMEKTQ